MLMDRTASFLVAVLIALFLWAFGAACFGVIIDAYVDHTYIFFMSQELDALFDTSGFIIMSCGIILIFIGLYILLSVCINKRWGYVISIVAQTLIGLLLIVGGVIAGIAKIQIESDELADVSDEMNQMLQKYYGVRSGFGIDFTGNWDDLQQGQRCCAPRPQQYQAFRTTEWFKETPGEIDVNKPYVPLSCCKMERDHGAVDLEKCQFFQDGPPKTTGGENNQYLHYRGCDEAFQDFVMEYTVHFMGLSISAGLFTLLMLLFPIFMISQLRKDPVGLVLSQPTGTIMMGGIGNQGYHTKA